MALKLRFLPPFTTLATRDIFTTRSAIRESSEFRESRLSDEGYIKI
jgi:hypothetical protein